MLVVVAVEQELVALVEVVEMVVAVMVELLIMAEMVLMEQAAVAVVDIAHHLLDQVVVVRVDLVL